MNLKIGEMNNLTVKRKTDIGYMLINDNNDEVLLHFNEANKELIENEDISVFLYFDSKKRLAATTKEPFIKVNEPGFVKVINVVENLGVFIDNNIAKDQLISLDDLTLDLDSWPQIDDIVFCKLKNTNTQLIAKLVKPEEIKSILTPNNALSKIEKVKAIVVKSGKEGVNLVTLAGHSIFVYYKNKRKDYRVGEEVEVTITNIKEDSTYNGTLIDDKVPMMQKDSDILLKYIEKNNGYIPFTSKSDLKEIEKTFNMSKSSFKRALGKLYKEKVIEIKEDGTYLNK